MLTVISSLLTSDLISLAWLHTKTIPEPNIAERPRGQTSNGPMGRHACLVETRSAVDCHPWFCLAPADVDCILVPLLGANIRPSNSLRTHAISNCCHHHLGHRLYSFASLGGLGPLSFMGDPAAVRWRLRRCSAFSGSNCRRAVFASRSRHEAEAMSAATFCCLSSTSRTSAVASWTAFVRVVCAKLAARMRSKADEGLGC